jgi:hypothetical protein
MDIAAIAQGRCNASINAQDTRPCVELHWRTRLLSPTAI